MNKIAVIYYSGTGNTEAMANALIEGVKSSGGTAVIIQAGIFSADMLDSYDGFAFGCPAMGSEGLEDEVFEPMFEGLLPHLSGRKLVLFGSYGWGDGQWMVDWKQTALDAGAQLLASPVIALDSPDEEALSASRELGVALCS